jgi:uncharacterized protein
VDVLTLERKKAFTRRDFLKLTGIAAVGLPLYAGEISRHEISVQKVTVTLPRLPDAFRGLTIAQVSDFHYAEYTEAYFIKQVIERVNQLKPDVVAFTGDFITTGFWSQPDMLRFTGECAEILSRVDCPLRYAVLGNHDCQKNLYCHAMSEALEQHNITLLENRAVPLERDGARLWFAGLGDVMVHRNRLDKAIPTASNDGEPVVLLVHEPDILPQVARYNVDLMLSGHTHGGQVRLPFLPPMFLPELGKHYVNGLYRLGPTQLYVNRGIGTVGLPFRLNCPPEITLITLA